MMMDYSDFEKFLISERINRSAGGGASYGQGITGTDQAAAFSDDMGLDDEAYEQFAEVANPGFNMGFAKQVGSGLLGLITGNPFAGLVSKGITALGGRFGSPGIRGGVALRGDSIFDTFGRSTSFADFAQRARDKKAREEAAARGARKQSRADFSKTRAGMFADRHGNGPGSGGGPGSGANEGGSGADSGSGTHGDPGD